MKGARRVRGKAWGNLYHSGYKAPRAYSTRQFISSVRSHPDRTSLSRIRGRSELYPRSEEQGCEARSDRRSSLHIHHAHIEFDERLCGMVEEPRGQETARILSEGRDLAEDPQQGHRHIGREPRRHHRTVMEGHQGEVRDRRLRHQPRRLRSGPVWPQIRVRGDGLRQGQEPREAAGGVHGRAARIAGHTDLHQALPRSTSDEAQFRDCVPELAGLLLRHNDPCRTALLHPLHPCFG